MPAKRKKRTRYKQKDIARILADPKRRLQPYSYMHPQISPTGQSFVEDDDAIALVSDAKRRYISNGFMKNRNISELAETRRDLTALMSLEGALTGAVHNAIQGYQMTEDPQATVSMLRGADRKAIEPPPQRASYQDWLSGTAAETFTSLGVGGEEYKKLTDRVGGNVPSTKQRDLMHEHLMKGMAYGAGYNKEYDEQVASRQQLPPTPPISAEIPEEEKELGAEIAKDMEPTESLDSPSESVPPSAPPPKAAPPKRKKNTAKQRAIKKYKDLTGNDAKTSWTEKIINEKISAYNSK